MTKKSIELRSRDDVRKSIFYNQCRFLERQYKEIGDLQFYLDHDTAELVFQVYCEYVKVLDPRAGKIGLISKLVNQLEVGAPQSIDQSLRDLTATLLCEQGNFGRGRQLYRPDDPRAIEIQHLFDKQGVFYGANLDEYRDQGYPLDRGVSLTFYFESHTELVRNKTVAHIAPEEELRKWFECQSTELSISYITIDGFSPDVHQHHDLCDMNLPDNLFDTIVCHRVLEHVLDHKEAIKELYRVLKPGGVLNISVPELFFVSKSIEWNVPDPNWHDHVRIYGRDFPGLLREAGFDVEQEDWLLKQSRSDLISQKAYPLYMYNALK